MAKSRSSSSRISARVEPVAGLDRGPAGKGGGEALEPVGPSTEPSAREVGDDLSKAGAGIEARVRRGHGVHHHRPAAECLRLESDAAELLAVPLDGLELLVGQLQGERQQQPLRRRAAPVQLRHHLLVQHPLMRRVLVDEHQPLRRLVDDVA